MENLIVWFGFIIILLTITTTFYLVMYRNDKWWRNYYMKQSDANFKSFMAAVDQNMALRKKCDTKNIPNKGHNAKKLFNHGNINY